MDLLAACRAFVSVSRHASFTAGAAAARIPQSVASRRISALEQHLGERLLDRSSRVVTLTAFGGELLPAARRLIELADALEHDAERARHRPFRLAVPSVCSVSSLSRLVTASRQQGLHLEIHPAEPAGTIGRQAAIVAVAPDAAAWQVPLGLAGGVDPGVPVIYVETLRPEPRRRPRRIWIQPEDDVPHLRDRLTRLAAAVGLLPAQTAVAADLVAATAETLTDDGLLLCSAEQARELGLHWRPIGELALTRGYDVVATSQEDTDRLRTLLHAPIASCLGAETAR